MRRFRVAASMQLAVLAFACAPALGKEAAPGGDQPAVEHVRHIRSRKTLKPTLFTDEEMQGANEAAESTGKGATAPKPVAVDTPTRVSAPRAKKVAARPAKAKERTVARIDRPKGPPLAPAAAPVSRGLLEDIFGDN